MTGSLKGYDELYRLAGPWWTAYVDAGTGPAAGGGGICPCFQVCPGTSGQNIDDDVYEAEAEQERVAAGLADYAPSDVPPVTDPLPAEASEAAISPSAAC